MPDRDGDEDNAYCDLRRQPCQGTAGRTAFRYVPRFVLAAPLDFAYSLRRTLKDRRGMVCGQGEQKQVGRSGEIGAITGRGHHSGLGADTNGNDDATELTGIAADVGNDLLSRQPAAFGEMTFQPTRKSLPHIAARGLDHARDIGDAQADISKIQPQQPD